MSTTQLQLLRDIVQTTVDRLDAVSGESIQGPAEEAGGVSISAIMDFAVLLTEAERKAVLPPVSPLGTPPALPKIIYAAWRVRADLYRSFDLRTLAGYAGIWQWALRDGRREIEDIRLAIDENRSKLIEPVQLPFDIKPPVSYPWIAGLLWCGRDDLRARYPLTDIKNVMDYLGWFTKTGIFELRCGDLVPDDHVAILATLAPASPMLPMTHYLHFVHEAREDLQSAFNLSDFDGRRAFLKWFFDNGVQEYPTSPEILAHQTKAIHEWRPIHSRTDMGG